MCEHVRALILKSVWGVFCAASCRMTNQKKSVCHTHKYIYYEAAPPLSLSVCAQLLQSVWSDKVYLSCAQGTGGGVGGVLKSCRSQTSDKFRTIGKLCASIVVAGALRSVDAALNDLQVKWIITTANAKKQDEVATPKGRVGGCGSKAYSYSWHGSNCQVSFVN